MKTFSNIIFQMMRAMLPAHLNGNAITGALAHH